MPKEEEEDAFFLPTLAIQLTNVFKINKQTNNLDVEQLYSLCSPSRGGGFTSTTGDNENGWVSSLFKLTFKLGLGLHPLSLPPEKKNKKEEKEEEIMLTIELRMTNKL